MEKSNLSERQRIKTDMRAKIAEIEKLADELKELKKQLLMLSDEHFQYVEEIEIVKLGKTQVIERPVGVLKWVEKHKDQDTDNIISIDRQRVISVHGVFTDKAMNYKSIHIATPEIR